MTGSPTSWKSRILGWFSRPRGALRGADEVRIKSRPIMDRVLREIFVPELKARGFTGSFPHFRRIKPSRIDLISFQYTRRGGQFMVTLARCEPHGIATAWGEQIPPGKVTVSDTFTGDRFYLSTKAGWRGRLFIFDRPSYDPPIANSEAAMAEPCAKAARIALEAFMRQAEPWWEKQSASGIDRG